MSELIKQTSLPKFDGNNSSVWKAQVEAYLITKEKVWVVRQTKPRLKVSYAATEAADKAAKEEEIKLFLKDDSYVKSLLLLALDNKHVKIVFKCGTAKKIWDRLCAIHEQKSAASKIGLQKEFFEVQISKQETVQDYVARAEYLHGQLQELGVEITQSTLVSKIVSCFMKRFLGFKST